MTSTYGTLWPLTGNWNPDIAYRYGWAFSWDAYKKSHPQLDRLPFNTIGSVLKNDTVYPDNPHLGVAYTDHLDAGDYTFSWTIHNRPWCELVSGGSEYWANVKVANSTFGFTVESGAPTPTFTRTYDGPDNLSSTILSCAVTVNATVTSEPCRATVNDALETSISSRLHWGAYATASTTVSGKTSAGSPMQASWMLSFLTTIKAHLTFPYSHEAEWLVVSRPSTVFVTSLLTVKRLRQVWN
ncbi:uncharacterized protein LY79DRAFT_579315 [Colletotrichum navitas]|uniref:DUF7136 domain-containing protein n=1 Tax=Colletotrichum navitas TaxID=681940 RepID=A0AAD8Q0F6_9PEZI|nr:uncharacterized protein LY79DRAFT_579315 [Colletotrichum navitas]KAK1593490.1 hypothetical protein LY79DRAFT_579315 [Colletotrichum navitas]